jgi:hypothetical protein
MTKLNHHLATGATGRASRCSDGDGNDIPMALRDGLGNGRSLGAQSEPVRSVFDVAASKEEPLTGQDGSPDGVL